MKNFSILCDPAVFRRLKMLAVSRGVRMGDCLAGLLVLAEASAPELVARAMAACDSQAGEIVAPGDEARHAEQERARGALPARTDEF